MSLQQKKIAFIGCGHMAMALVQGLLKQEIPAKNMWVTGRWRDKLNTLKKEKGVNITTDNAEAVMHADVVLFCVKPQQLKAVCCALTGSVHKKKPLVISVATGVTLSLLSDWLGNEVALIRAMPNTPSAIGEGVTGLTANHQVQASQIALAKNLFDTVGVSFYFANENQLNVVTALSGCGPAYVFLLLEALQEAAVAAGLDAKEAGLMAQHMTLGAARMALASHKMAAELRREVASPGGATEQALVALQQGGFHKLIATAFNKALQRATELTRQLV